MDPAANGEASQPSTRPKAITVPGIFKPLKMLSFLDLNPITLAEQLTLREHAVFKKIELKELYRWTKSENSTLRTAVEFVNKLGYWVATEILIGDYSKVQRTQVIEKFLTIAEKMEELHNYNGIVAILGGLSNSSVSRLHKSWKGLSSHARAIYNKILLIASPDKSFAFYKDVISKAQPPCIPILVYITSNIAKIDESNPDRLKDLVNIGKIELFAKLFKEMLKYQKREYTLTPDENIQAYLNNLPIASDELLYKHSCLAEKKKTSHLSVELAAGTST